MTRHWPALIVAAALTVSAFPCSLSAQTLRLTAHKDYSSGYGPASIAVGDINGDSLPDLGVALSFSDTVAVLPGNADGSFQPPRLVYLGPGTNPRSVAIGDFNRDGKPDLAVANPTSNTITVLPGNGDGTFQPVTTLGAGTGPSSVAVGDFNGDSNPDLAVANNGSNNVSVLLGNGNGTFQPARTFAADSGAAFVAVGDFNRDGRPDLAVANTGAGTVSALLGNGDGNFQAPRTFAAGNGVLAVAVGDFDRDGTPDLATANNGANTVAVLRGNGDGTFRAAQAFAVGNGPTSVAAGDFNRDGRPDLAVAFYQPATSSGFFVSVLPGNGDGTFQTPQIFNAGYESLAIAVGDFNADGAPDLTVANTYSTTVSVLLNAGDGTFPATPNYKASRNPESIVVGDFNRDSRRDLAVANAGSNTVSVLLGNGDGTFQAAVSVGAGPGPTAIALGDFNRDNNQDLVVSNYGNADYYAPPSFVTATVSVLLGNGDGTFRPAQAFASGTGPNAVAVGDFNSDGVQDLAVADYGVYPQRGTTVSILVGNGDGSFGAPRPFQSGNAPSCVAVGDVNRDGIQDLASCNYNDNNVAVLLGNGDATFRHAGTVAVGVAPWFVVFDDLNGDQLPDFAVTGHWSDIVSSVMGNGDGTFQPHRWFLTDRGPTGLAVADLNGDGRRDLATANYFSTTVSVLLGNGDGTMQAAQHFGADLAPMGLAAGDFNGDGQPDLAATNYFASSVSVLTNRTSAPRAAAPTFNPPGGTYVGSMTVALATTTTGATIHFTIDGSTPTTASNVYTTPILVAQTTTIRAMAVASGMGDSSVAAATYTILLPVATPTFSPPAGTYAGSAAVTISVTTSGATIRYTTDGSTPTAASAVYTSPIPVTQTTTIRAMASASGMADSAVASAAYTILQQVATPAFSPPGGTYVGVATVTMNVPTSGATIHYTTDGSTPTATSPAYTGPLSITQTRTIRAIATASGMADSQVASATYTIQVVTPTFSVPPGTYNQPQTVTVSTTTGGATIYYTIDGTTPTPASTRYTGPIAVPRSTTIRAMAVATGMANSAVASVTYTLQAATPTFNPAGGSYLLPQFVTISDASPNVTIYYTTDGSTPTTSSTQYTGSAIFVGLGTTTIRAIAVAPGWSQSAVASATYRIGL